jgi:hypothetical protein
MFAGEFHAHAEAGGLFQLPPIYHALQQRLAQRDDLLNLCQQVDNQLHALRQHPEVIPEVRARMEHLGVEKLLDRASPYLRSH